MSAFAVTINAAGLQVLPGASATFTVDVRNVGDVVDRYRCELVGLDPSWWSVSPASLELFPHRDVDDRARAGSPPSDGRFTVTIHPPRTSAALAGQWGIGAKVSSENTPTDRRVEETALTILPFGLLEADLRPAVMSGRFGASAALHLMNAGNRPEELTITGSDRTDRLTFKIERPVLTLRPGEASRLRLQIAGGGVIVIGGSDTRPFVVDVRARTPDTAPLTLSGTLERKPIIPSGVPVAVATLAALALGALALWFGVLQPKPADLASAQSPAAPTAIVSQAPPSEAPPTSAPPSEAPPSSAPPTDSPSPVITDSPRPADLCVSGFVWREAFDGDHVCVTPEQRAQVQADNAAAATRKDPTAGYGPDGCVAGYVWRVARPEDLVCVTPEERTQVADDNAQAASRVAP